MNDKNNFRRNENKSVEREFFPLQDVLNDGAIFIKYEPFVEEDFSKKLSDINEEDKNE